MFCVSSGLLYKAIKIVKNALFFGVLRLNSIVKIDYLLHLSKSSILLLEIRILE